MSFKCGRHFYRENLDDELLVPDPRGTAIRRAIDAVFGAGGRLLLLQHPQEALLTHRYIEWEDVN